MPPQARGRIAYNDSMDGINFAHRRLPLSAIVEQLSRYALFDNPPSVAVQSALIPECLPGFAVENRLPVLDEAVAPRIWLGNRVTVPAHVDESNNVACVVAGRRRFTLFPPEQVSNLYIGPLDYAPTGAAMSVADLVEPDFERFPRLKDALSAAYVAELAPGDALFIPTLWWHHVESLDQQLNVPRQLLVERHHRHRRENGIGPGLSAAQPAEHQAAAAGAEARPGLRCSITTSSTRVMIGSHTSRSTGAVCSERCRRRPRRRSGTS